jgi:hypothetical protein
VSINTVRCVTTFTTGTYNVLAQSFVHVDRYPYSSAEALDPTPRHNLLLDDRPLHVACTHLVWQPASTPRADRIGYHQMLELIAHRDAVAYPVSLPATEHEKPSEREL